MTERWDTLLVDCRLATLTGDAPYGAIENAALGWKDGTIAFAGPASALPDAPDALAARVESLGNAWITPGLVDCHTHLVFGGNRAHEFERRLEGATYEEIARAGGGILSTVRATRDASEDELLAQSLPRARALVADGATTIEIKSGLRARSRDRAQDAARRASHRHDARHRRQRDAARRACAAARVQGSRRRLHRCDLQRDAAGRRARRSRRCGRCVLRAHRVFARADAARVREGALARGCRSSCTPISFRISAAPRWRPSSAHARPSISSTRARTAFAQWPRAAPLRRCCRARITRCAKRSCRRSKRSARTAFRSRSRPTATRARRRCCRCGLAMSMACTLFRLTPEEALRGATTNAARALGLDDRGTPRSGPARRFRRLEHRAAR